MRRSSDFTSVVRAGLRARTGRIVVHHVTELAADSSSPALVGFVVSKSVGNSVDRHAVSRRLRGQVAARLDRLPAGSGTVIRALPAAAAAGSAELGRDLDRALARVRPQTEHAAAAR